LVFISYRRTDSQQAAFGLFSQLGERFGRNRVFMDRFGISGGDIWPERLHEFLNKATVVIALMGPGWLKCADEYGRRRLDRRDDWVRNELLAAIKAKTPIIPVLLSGASMPPPDALPGCLKPLHTDHALSLRDDDWDAGLNTIMDTLIKRDFPEPRKVPVPDPRVKVQPLSETELHTELQSLPEWEPVESLIPGDYPKVRQELRRTYIFHSFKAAIQFMNAAVAPVNSTQHHPRWENQWKTVTVSLSTWDIKNRISRLDVDLARIFDELYEQIAHPISN
jgi:pterin-4a-carbinolamine dehydratase